MIENEWDRKYAESAERTEKMRIALLEALRKPEFLNSHTIERSVDKIREIDPDFADYLEKLPEASCTIKGTGPREKKEDIEKPFLVEEEPLRLMYITENADGKKVLVTADFTLNQLLESLGDEQTEEKEQVRLLVKSIKSHDYVHQAENNEHSTIPRYSAVQNGQRWIEHDLRMALQLQLTVIAKEKDGHSVKLSGGDLTWSDVGGDWDKKYEQYTEKKENKVE